MGKPKGKHRNRITDRRLWDDHDDVWELIDPKVGKDAVERLLLDVGVRLCIHDDFGQPLRWIAPDRRRAIRTELAPWFVEDFHVRTSGRYFTMMLWGRGPRRHFIENLVDKLGNADFVGDVQNLTTNVPNGYSPQAAADLVLDRLAPHLPA